MKDVLRQVLAAATGEVIKVGRSAGGAETVKKVEDSIKNYLAAANRAAHPRRWAERRAMAPANEMGAG